LRVFDLQLALARAGALAEDFQDQRGAVHDLDAEDLLQVARLRRGDSSSSKMTVSTSPSLHSLANSSALPGPM
jgi:hypothetical protein